MALRTDTPVAPPSEITAAGTPAQEGGVQIAQAEAVAEVPQQPTETIIEVEGTILRLPEGTDIDSPRVNGANLEFVQPDGSVIVVPNGAIEGLTIFIGAVELPPIAVAALFEANGIEAAAGPEAGGPRSSGADFSRPVGSIGDGIEFGGLLSDDPANEIGGPGERDEYLPNLAPIFGLPRIFSVRLSEEGFLGANADGTGSADKTDQTTYSFTLDVIDPNGDPLTFTFGQPLLAMSSGGVAITWTGVGTSSLTGWAGADMVIEASIDSATKVLTVNLLKTLDHLGSGEDELGMDLPISVSDGRGGTADAIIRVIVEDDMPEARDVSRDMTENKTLVIDLVEGVDFNPGADGGSISFGAGSIFPVESKFGDFDPASILSLNGTQVTVTLGTAFDALGADETLTLVIPYTVTDGDNDSVTRNITITIQGTNDAPVVLGETNEVTEAGVVPDGNTSTSGDALAMGNVLSNDSDVENDALSVTGLDGGSQVLGAFVKSGTYGVLTLGANGGYAYVLNNLDPDTFGLRQGQSLEEVFTYTVSDGNGGFAQASLTIMVHGTNDRPYAVALLSDTTGSVREDVGAVSATGNIAFQDVDLGYAGNDYTISLGMPSVTNISGNQAGAIAALDPADWLQLGAVTGSSGITNLLNTDWTFNAPNGELDFLNNGDRVRLTYTVTITDPERASFTRDITITLRGTNDGPVINIVESDLTGSVVESGAIADVMGAGPAGALSHSFDLTSVAGKLAVLRIGTGAAQFDTAYQSLLGVPGIDGADDVAIAVMWRHLDGLYVGAAPEQVTAVNEAFVRLGVAYAKLLAEGKIGPLTDIIAKYTADKNDAGEFPDRLQSLHDNLLGNLNGNVLNGRFTGDLLAELRALVDGVDGVIAPATDALLLRQAYDGNEIAGSGGGYRTGEIYDASNGLVARASGKIIATDADAGDVLTYSGNATSAYGRFEINAGSGEWTYVLDQGAANKLAQDEKATETFAVTVTDGQNATATATVTITISGTNDAPAITVEADDVARTGWINEAATISASGSLTASDVDVTDVLSASVVSASAIGSGFNTRFTEVQLLSFFQLASTPIDTASTTTGKIFWSFTSPEANFDFMPGGWEGTITYVVRVSDSNGGFDTQNVEIRIKGTNDGAQIGEATVTALTEDQNVASGNLVAEGTIAVHDVDINQSQFSTSVSNVTANLGTLVLQSSGAYIYTIANAAVQYLGANDKRIETFLVRSVDGTSKEISFTINGTNDGPVIEWSATIADLYETANVTGSSSVLNKGGSFRFSDVDAGDTHSAVVTKLASDYDANDSNAFVGTFTAWIENSPNNGALDNGSLKWNLAVVSSSIDYLAAGQKITQTYRVEVKDASGAVSSRIVTAEIIGRNDAASISVDVADDRSVIEAGGIANGTAGDTVASGKLFVTDVDTGEAVFRAPAASSLNGTYGTFEFNAATGVWSYELDNSRGTTQGLVQGQKAFDTLTVTSFDGTASHDISVEINGTNDGPVIKGTTSETYVSSGIGGVVEADENIDATTGKGDLKGIVDLGNTIKTAMADNPADMATVLSNVASALTTAGQPDTLANAIVYVWDNLNANYNDAGYYATPANELLVRLGVEYAKYLKAGNPPLLDIVAKFTIDGSDADANPDRVQSLHDNLLGNFNAIDMASRFSGQLLSDLKALIASVDPILLTRPAYSGNEGSVNNALAWDQLHGYAPAQAGKFTAEDVDQPTNVLLQWSASAGVFGRFVIDASTGEWSYTLDHSRPALQALAPGEPATETVTVTVKDEFDAVDTFTLTLTATGINDAPVISGGDLTGEAYDAGFNASHVLVGSTSIDGQLVYSDSDPDDTPANDHWSVSGPSSGLYGAFSINQGGKWTYVLDQAKANVLGLGEAATESFTVRLADSRGAYTEQTITITVHGSAEGPVEVWNGSTYANSYTSIQAANDAATTLAGMTIRIVEPSYRSVAATITKENLSIEGAAQNTGIMLTLGAGVLNMSLLGAAPFRVEGNGEANVINGNDGANVFVGRAGNDTLNGGDGDDLFHLVTGGSGDNNGLDQYDGGAGYDVIRGGGSYDVLHVASDLSNLNGIEEINGGDGQPAYNSIKGTSGDDVLDFSSASGKNIKLVDFVIDGGTGNDEIIGHETSKNHIRGGLGDDTLVGGNLNDRFYLSTGEDSGFDSYDGGSGYDKIVGGWSYDTLHVLNGLTNIKSIEELDGGDTTQGRNKIVATSDDDSLDFSRIVVKHFHVESGGGNDTVYASTNTVGSIRYNGGDGVDALVVTITEAQLQNANLMGQLAQLAANNGNGSVNAENLTFSSTNFESLKVQVRIGDVDIPISTNIWTGTSNHESGNPSHRPELNVLAGKPSQANEAWTIFGLGGDDRITGGNNDDILVGGTGWDKMDGGEGSDTYLVGPNDNTSEYGDEFRDSGGDGYDRIVATGANTLIAARALSGIEEITAGGFAGVNLAGATNAHNTLDLRDTRLVGINEVRGGGATSTDTFYTSNVGDPDHVQAYRGGAANDTFHLGSQDTRLMYSGTGNGFDGFNGNTAAAIHTAIADSDNTNIGIGGVYSGDKSVDVISADGHSNVRIVGTDSNHQDWDFTGTTLTDIASIEGAGGSDKITGSAGDDVIYGHGGNDILTGGDGNDILWGGIGNDRLTGGAGNDTLFGGEGRDTFVFKEAGVADVDTIKDYVFGSGSEDVVDLSDLLSGVTAGNFASKVQAVQQGANALLQVNQSGSWVDVVVVENLTLTSDNDIRVLIDGVHHNI